MIESIIYLMIIGAGAFLAGYILEYNNHSRRARLSYFLRG